MCTVSFVNSGGAVIITSSRDEKVMRPAAIAPRNYSCRGKNIMYPKDSKAGGTWFAVDENGTVAVLLNGGTLKHTPVLSYRKSRGLIVLDLIADGSPKDFWRQIDLQGIEPFTLVLYQQKSLYELIWDGCRKTTNKLDQARSYIWSSVTLYPEEIRKKRAGWFFGFISDKNEISASDMLDFHKNTHSGDSQNGLVINRENGMKTLSVTQVVTRQNKATLNYCDLAEARDFSTSFIKI